MSTTIEQLATQVNAVLTGMMAIDVDQLERLVQAVHECTPQQMREPDKRFCISRQALRMFWHFRCNLKSVEVTPTHE